MIGLSLRFVPSLVMYFLFFFFFFISNINIASASPARHLCLPDQKDALVEFKNEFRIKPDDRIDITPRTESWIDSVDCCSWNGVTCGSVHGHVIELDLAQSFLDGALKMDSSLFKLQHLRSLILEDNQISGELPSSIDTLRSLKKLSLSNCNLFGRLPSSLGNFTHLSHLDLSGNGFNGEVPSSISNLFRLTYLDLRSNKLEGDFPLQLLNLTELSVLYLGYNELSGSLPWNLSRLSKLVEFHVDENSISGVVPSSLFMIPSLISIDLSGNHLTSPLELGNVSSSSNLQYLDLRDNHFHGQIPKSISKLFRLVSLDLSFWKTVSVVDFITSLHLKHLDHLVLEYMEMRSRIDFSIFSDLTSLRSLHLSGNDLYINSTLNSFPPQFKVLTLSACSITEFPPFLLSQTHLVGLDLSRNKIRGRVPKRLWQLPNLQGLNISQNYFSVFEGSSDVALKSQIYLLDISSNRFHGLLPTLPKSAEILLSSSNQFSGEIPPWICELTYPQTLDLSNNNFSGSIPRCFENLKSSLLVLHLQNNSLSGSIPPESINAYYLMSLNLGHNQIVGKLPRSLINCSHLQLLNVEHNQIHDEFPFWLQSLPSLQILVLRSNQFYGSIYSPRLSLGFSMLRMIDISQNNFSGILPSNYFSNWSALAVIETNKDYEQFLLTPGFDAFDFESVVLMNKGLPMELIWSSFVIYTVIDFSGNRFSGNIPESISLLKDLIVLNMSNNGFTSHIPSSLVNLTNLQSLDLSRNNLSGTIPQELGNLSFLSKIDFSCNSLSGPIPQGTQFSIQPCSAFLENSGLYGPPLGQSCDGGGHVPRPQQSEEPELEEEEEEIISWMAMGIGVVPGVLFGLTLGYIYGEQRHEWFMEITGRMKRRWSSSL